jgi:hypothetical protein
MKPAMTLQNFITDIPCLDDSPDRDFNGQCTPAHRSSPEKCGLRMVDPARRTRGRDRAKAAAPRRDAADAGGRLIIERTWTDELAVSPLGVGRPPALFRAGRRIFPLTASARRSKLMISGVNRKI